MEIKQLGPLVLGITVPLAFAFVFLSNLATQVGEGTAQNAILSIMTIVTNNIPLIGLVMLAIFLGAAWKYAEGISGGGSREHGKK